MAARDARLFRSATMGVILFAIAAAVLMLPPPASAGSGDIFEHGSLMGLTTDRDALFDVAEGPNGTLYVAGTLDQGITGGWIVVAKYDAETNLSWRRSYRPPGMTDAGGSCLAVDASGNVVVGGVATDGADYDLVVAKWSAVGDLVWTAVRDGGSGLNDSLTDLAVARDGSVYACGDIDGSDHAIVLRYARDADPSAPGAGLERWHRLVHSAAPYAGASANAIVLDRSGNAYVTGARESASHEADVFTVKFNASGARRWLRSWDGAAHAYDSGMHLALAGRSVYVAVNTDTRKRSTDLALIRYDTSGRRHWVRLWDDPRHQADNVAALACDTKGGVYLAADTWPTATTQKATLIKYTTAGRRAWQRGYKGATGDGGTNASDLVVGSSGTAWIVGYLFRPSAVTQWYAVRYAPTGSRRWVTRWDGFPNDPQRGQAWACALTGTRDLVVVGELGTSGLGRVGGVLWLRR
jgi:hypothetical protein